MNPAATAYPARARPDEFPDVRQNKHSNAIQRIDGNSYKDIIEKLRNIKKRNEHYSIDAHREHAQG